MALKEEIESDVKSIFSERWSVSDGTVVPEPETVKLSNEGIKLDATVLYADMADSTKLVMNYKPEFAAEIYKAFLRTACKIIRAHDGEITAFDGDRVMAIFIGGSKNSNAAKTALKIDYAVAKILNPKLAETYQQTQYTIDYSVGIDTSTIMAARTGIRGSNDLVWVGNAANIAAKLCSLKSGSKRTWITERVFEKLSEETKYGGGNKSLMWELNNWSDFGINVYSSNWHWPF